MTSTPEHDREPSRESGTSEEGGAKIPLPGIEGFTGARPGNGRLVTTLWTAADKGLVLLYGAAVVVIPLHFGILQDNEFGTWQLFQVFFLSISLFGDYLLLQPMVKFASEHEAEPRPIITAGSILYVSAALLLAAPVTLFPGFWSDLLKTGAIGREAFFWIVPTVLATLGRNIAIRVLQIDLQIVRIFVLDLVYFGGFILFMFIGWQDGSFQSTMDMVTYNFWSLAASSIVGAALCGRLIVPLFRGVVDGMKKIIGIAHHQGGTGLMTIIQQNVDVVIVSGTRGSAAAGIYAVARIFYRVFEALREAAQLLLISATSNAWSRQEIDRVKDLTVLSAAALSAILYPATILLILLSPVAMPLILPESNFAEAVVPFQWLIASGFPMPFVIVPSAVLLGIGKTKDLVTGMALGTGTMVISGIFLTWLFGAEGMAIAVLLGNSTIALILTSRMNRYIDFSFRSVMQRIRNFWKDARHRWKNR